jgi:hypothetical protein
MPPRLKHNILTNFYRPCYNAQERGPPARERENYPQKTPTHPKITPQNPTVTPKEFTFIRTSRSKSLQFLEDVLLYVQHFSDSLVQICLRRTCDNQQTPGPKRSFSAP